MNRAQRRFIKDLEKIFVFDNLIVEKQYEVIREQKRWLEMQRKLLARDRR
jgi:hypothetical protein